MRFERIFVSLYCIGGDEPNMALFCRHHEVCGLFAIYMKALNGFLMTQRQTLKDECVYIMLVNFIGQVFRTPS